MRSQRTVLNVLRNLFRFCPLNYICFVTVHYVHKGKNKNGKEVSTCPQLGVKRKPENVGEPFGPLRLPKL